MKTKLYLEKIFFKKNIILKITFIVFTIFISLNSNKTCTSCGCSGGQTRCGECGQTQPICCNSFCNGYPFLLPRSQGRNSARELVGCQQMLYKYDTESLNGFLSAAVEYQRSFDNQQIPRYYFGADYVNCKNLLIQGSQVNNRHANAWLADYFGLPTDYNSVVSFCPLLQNVTVDLNFYLGLDKAAEGLYLKVVAPIAWTCSQLCPIEKICNYGTNDAISGYLSTGTILRQDLNSSFLEYMCGCANNACSCNYGSSCSNSCSTCYGNSGSCSGCNSNTNYSQNSCEWLGCSCGNCPVFGDMQQPLKYGIISGNKLTKAGLAELRASLGYNFALEEDYHFGMFFELSAPTGNRPCAKYLFEPIIGNGKHWEIGGGLTGHWIFHRSQENKDKYVGFWIDATLAHLAKSCQKRSFDISCKNNGRYMLLEQMGLNKDNLKSTDSTLATYQYQKILLPTINWSTFNVQTCMDLQTDIAAKIAFFKNNFSLDLGYNFWARMGEKISFDNCCGCQPTYNMAIKGDSFVYGYYDDSGTMKPIALSATESDASIHSGTNYPYVSINNATNVAINPAIDAPENASACIYSSNPVQTVQLNNIYNTAAVNTSIQPTLIARGDLNNDDSPAGITHKLFAHFNYYHKNSDKKWLPFIGIGGEVEFSTYRYKCGSCCNNTGSGCSCSGSFNTCQNCSSCNTCTSCPNNSCCQNSTTNSGICTGPNSPYICDFCCDPSCNKRMGICQWGTWIKGGISFN